MKKNSLFITNLIILAVGVLFLAASKQDNFIKVMIYFMGILFIVPGVVSIFDVIHDGSKPSEERKIKGVKRLTSWTVAVGAIVLGVAMCFFPQFFSSIVIGLLGVTIACGGLYHVIMFVHGLRPVKMPIWLYILPLLLIAGGLWLLFGKFTHEAAGDIQVVDDKKVFIISGIGIILFAVTTFIEMICVRAYNKHQQKLQHQQAGAQETADAEHRIENE